MQFIVDANNLSVRYSAAQCPLTLASLGPRRAKVQHGVMWFTLACSCRSAVQCIVMGLTLAYLCAKVQYSVMSLTLRFDSTVMLLLTEDDPRSPSTPSPPPPPPTLLRARLYAYRGAY